ncbi:alcohol dehydrogenase catalytic domain-containing protein, partial [Verrucomicrobia bacterium]|nr:alcohol dehydrogenase catalytic domain-containing protein [Verrucomicrobiota bacterium]
MKAAILRQLKQPLQLESRPDLEPDPDHAIVDLKTAALNRRDYWITCGMYPDIRTPVVLGSDGAGTVSKTGVGVDSDWNGRKVIIQPGLNWG